MRKKGDVYSILVTRSCPFARDPAEEGKAFLIMTLNLQKENERQAHTTSTISRAISKRAEDWRNTRVV
jgi:hypothetical protein